MKLIFTLVTICITIVSYAQQTPYEKNGKNYTATYTECINYYKQLAKQYKCISVKEMGNTDANIPLHIVTISADNIHNPATWHKQNRVVLLINNGIHPGEPDGIDASMLLARDIIEVINEKKISANIAIVIIPVYNIGGMLNRSPYYRIDQDGPEAFGSRGNSQNLDLNRDFIKCDSKEAKSFASIFHYVKPHIFLDNHVSDGADYPYNFTLATTQKDKLGGNLGTYINNIMEPDLYKAMEQKGEQIIPYVNAWGTDARKGWPQFFDSPRYSSGYATLFNCISFVAETHMLKPYAKRVNATYTFMQVLIKYMLANSNTIIAQKKLADANLQKQNEFAVAWKHNKVKYTPIEFTGYEYKQKLSTISNLPINYYDHNSLYHETINFYNTYDADVIVNAPQAYIIPQGWYKVIELLQLNHVQMQTIPADTIIAVQAYTIDGYKSNNTPYESHHSNTQVKVKTTTISKPCRKGDYIIPIQQPAKRFIIETLEPQGMDSYFTWNFFDAILNQKEGYTTYAYEPIVAAFLNTKEGANLKDSITAISLRDTAFAKDIEAQLDYVYKHSPYYEPQHNAYPVYRLAPKLAINNSNKHQQEIINKKDE